MHLAIDAGGTSTRAVLVEPDGTCRGYGIAGGGNPVSWGPEAALRAVLDAATVAVGQWRSRMQRASAGESIGESELADESFGGVASAGGWALDVDGTAIAMAGSSVAVRPEAYASALRKIGVTTPVLFESDLLATFCAGTPESDGYAVVAGTGSSAIRVRGGEVTGTADGLGWLLGDAGSGFWIGHRVVRAAVAALDDRGPATVLSSLLLEALDLAAGEVGGATDGVPDAIGEAPDTRDGARDPGGRRVSLRRATDALYAIRPVELSRFAVLAFRGAELGDPVGQRILADAERSLLDTLDAVRTPGPAGPVVLGGGIARRLVSLPAAVAGLVRSWGDDEPTVIVVTDGIVGAGVLALRRGGIAVDRAEFDRLASTVAGLRDDGPA